jgi:hypothetical protein
MTINSSVKRWGMDWMAGVQNPVSAPKTFLFTTTTRTTLEHVLVYQVDTGDHLSQEKLHIFSMLS